MKPSERIEQLKVELEKEYTPRDFGLYTTEQVAAMRARAIIQFLDESQEPKALEECPECHYPKGEAHARRCPMRRDGLVWDMVEKLCLCGHVSTAHMNAGCNGTVEDHCPCKLFVEAKPQDEPKKCCEECAPYEGDNDWCKNPACPCHQESGTEVKEYPVIKMMGYKIEGHIVLEKPKGMSIGESLYHFLEESPTVWFVSDDDFMTAWKVFLKSLEK